MKYCPEILHNLNLGPRYDWKPWHYKDKILQRSKWLEIASEVRLESKQTLRRETSEMGERKCKVLKNQFELSLSGPFNDPKGELWVAYSIYY